MISYRVRGWHCCHRPPLRTVLAVFTAHGSSISNALFGRRGTATVAFCGISLPVQLNMTDWMHRLLRFRKVSLQIELISNESLSHRRRAQRAQSPRREPLRPAAPCGGERDLHQALLELCKLIYLKLNSSLSP